MTKKEFLSVIYMLNAIISPPLEKKESLEVYYSLLKDISFEKFKRGAERLLLENESFYGSFPTIAQLRKYADDTEIDKINYRLDILLFGFDNLPDYEDGFEKRARGLKNQEEGTPLLGINKKL